MNTFHTLNQGPQSMSHHASRMESGEKQPGLMSRLRRGVRSAVDSVMETMQKEVPVPRALEQTMNSIGGKVHDVMSAVGSKTASFWNQQKRAMKLGATGVATAAALVACGVSSSPTGVYAPVAVAASAEPQTAEKEEGVVEAEEVVEDQRPMPQIKRLFRPSGFEGAVGAFSVVDDTEGDKNPATQFAVNDQRKGQISVYNHNERRGGLESVMRVPYDPLLQKIEISSGLSPILAGNTRIGDYVYGFVVNAKEGTSYRIPWGKILATGDVHLPWEITNVNKKFEAHSELAGQIGVVLFARRFTAGDKSEVIQLLAGTDYVTFPTDNYKVLQLPRGTWSEPLTFDGLVGADGVPYALSFHFEGWKVYDVASLLAGEVRVVAEIPHLEPLNSEDKHVVTDSLEGALRWYSKSVEDGSGDALLTVQDFGRDIANPALYQYRIPGEYTRRGVELITMKDKEALRQFLIVALENSNGTQDIVDIEFKTPVGTFGVTQDAQVPKEIPSLLAEGRRLPAIEKGKSLRNISTGNNTSWVYMDYKGLELYTYEAEKSN